MADILCHAVATELVAPVPSPVASTFANPLSLSLSGASRGAADIYSLEDKTLAARFQFLKEVGVGCWGSVWHVRPKLRESITRADLDAPLPAGCAIKLVHRSKTPTTAARIRALWSEYKHIRALRSDQHPNLIAFSDFIITPSYAIIVMDYHDRVMPVEIPETCARAYCAQLLDGLGYLHRKGCTHNDIKVANILLSSDDRPVIVDFGFAQYYKAHSPSHKRAVSSLSLPAGVGPDILGKSVNGQPAKEPFMSALSWGTPEYLAPERARGRYHDERLADIWSLGVTMYEMVVGRTPFERDETEEFLTKEALEVYYQRTISGDFFGVYNLSPGYEAVIRSMVCSELSVRAARCEDVLAMAFFQPEPPVKRRSHRNSVHGSSPARSTRNSAKKIKVFVDPDAPPTPTRPPIVPGTPLQARSISAGNALKPITGDVVNASASPIKSPSKLNDVFTAKSTPKVSRVPVPARPASPTKALETRAKAVSVLERRIAASPVRDLAASTDKLEKSAVRSPTPSSLRVFRPATPAKDLRPPTPAKDLRATSPASAVFASFSTELDSEPSKASTKPNKLIKPRPASVKSRSSGLSLHAVAALKPSLSNLTRSSSLRTRRSKASSTFAMVEHEEAVQPVKKMSLPSTRIAKMNEELAFTEKLDRIQTFTQQINQIVESARAAYDRVPLPTPPALPFTESTTDELATARIIDVNQLRDYAKKVDDLRREASDQAAAAAQQRGVRPRSASTVTATSLSRSKSRARSRPASPAPPTVKLRPSLTPSFCDGAPTAEAGEKMQADKAAPIDESSEVDGLSSCSLHSRSSFTSSIDHGDVTQTCKVQLHLAASTSMASISTVPAIVLTESSEPRSRDERRTASVLLNRSCWSPDSMLHEAEDRLADPPSTPQEPMTEMDLEDETLVISQPAVSPHVYTRFIEASQTSVTRDSVTIDRFSAGSPPPRMSESSVASSRLWSLSSSRVASPTPSLTRRAAKKALGLLRPGSRAELRVNSPPPHRSEPAGLKRVASYLRSKLSTSTTSTSH